MSHEPNWCPVYRPTRADFQRPFVDYVQEIFRENPDLPMFKLVPPSNWRPRRTKFPDLKDIKIRTPIRQHVFGSRGAYRCVLVEQKEMAVSDFKRIAEEEERQPTETLKRKIKEAKDEAEADSLLERSFWGSVTLNPPLYGADTPVSFFDPKLAYGWNMSNLGDLLKTSKVPEVPGVTTPMTYFGMWRAFFGWHKEDKDLLSINYLHFGAAKYWYCVSPKDSDKFDRMTQSLYPQHYHACKAFIRHKDILLSPALLRTHGIPFMQAKQEENEFVVLNAAAYHSGFNMGFNCAEAINFATPDWIEKGKMADGCTCRQDTVHISMRLFDPEWSGSESEDSDEEESEEEEEEEEEEQPVAKKRPLSAKDGKSILMKRRKVEPDEKKPRAKKAPRTPSPIQRQSSKAGGKGVAKSGSRGDAKKAAGVKVSTPKDQLVITGVSRSGRERKMSTGGGRRSMSPPNNVTAIVAKAPPLGGVRVKGGGAIMDEGGEPMPEAVLLENDKGEKYFLLVQRVKQPKAPKGMVMLRWLRECSSDHLYRPVDHYWEEDPNALISVRCSLMAEGGKVLVGPQAAFSPKIPSIPAGSTISSSSLATSEDGFRPGWKLLTMKSKILATQIVQPSE